MTSPEQPRHVPTFTPSLAPDGGSFAHLVDAGGYPQAVQRALTGASVTASRPVRLPTDGPITRAFYSPNGAWLACQTMPHAGDRGQVWVVTNDPEDPTAWRVDDPASASAELIGWNGDLVSLTLEHEDGVGEARLVDPRYGGVTILDRRYDGRLLDAWAEATLVRVGHRCDRSLRLLTHEGELPIFADDPGSTSDPGVILEDHRPWRVMSDDGSIVHDPRAGDVRLVVRTDYDSDRLRLVLVTAREQDSSYRVLAERADSDLDEFVVSADGSTAALLWNVDGGRSELQLLELADDTLHPPTPLPGPLASQLTINADGSVIGLTVQGPGAPRSVHLYARRHGEWAAVDPVPPDPDAVMPTSIRFAARDGLELQAWWYDSPHATGPAPTIVDFHGGPEGQARPGHSDLYPLLLAQGWHVVAPNIRGSAGFGRAYVHADDLERRYAGIDDVADVVAHLVAEGIADPDRLVCTGRSYGGYLTLASLTMHPDLFAGGISTCGMSDLHTFYETTETWIGRAAMTKYGDPRQHADLLTDLSPIHRVDQVRAPLLLVHGTKDTNVPPSESVQMHEALDALGKPVEILLVDDEGHEIHKPENRSWIARVTCRWLADLFADVDRRSEETDQTDQADRTDSAQVG